MDAKAAGQLAYYSSTSDFGVLAPRGWYCFGTYGSDSTSLFISPQRFKQDDLSSESWNGFSGPVIEISMISGGTSGRFEVAKAIARVFPAHKSFVSNVVNEGIEPSSSFTSGPYPDDKLTYKGKETVEYTTPVNAKGLGVSRFIKSEAGSVSGVLMLTGADTDLVHLSVRLSPEQAQLVPIIIHQFEREVLAQPDATPAKSPNRKPPVSMLKQAPTSASKGYPVPEKDFVAAYVIANLGRDGHDQSQLEVLAHDEYEMGKMMETKNLLQAEALFNTRGGRAMAYLEKIAQQPQ